MTQLQDYGNLLLGSRLRRLAEQMYSAVDDIYRAHGVRQSSSLFPILFMLRDDDEALVPVMEMAARLGLSHPAVVRMYRKLVRDGLIIDTGDAKDMRKRLLGMANKGRALMQRLDSVWRAIDGTVADLAAETGSDLAAAVGAFETALAQRGFAERIDARLRAGRRDAVEILDFLPQFRDDFARLNLTWLERHFTVEKIDHEVLSEPEEHILDPGGFIFFARLDGEIVGTCALIRHPRGRYELSKMAVSEDHRGLGIGRKLLERAVARFHEVRGKQLYLESNQKLKPALQLYETGGFRHAPRPKGPSPYQRSDVYMVYDAPVSRARQPRRRR